MAAKPRPPYPAFYRQLTRIGEPPEQAAARAELNPYRRRRLIDAFDAGWFSHTVRSRLGNGVSSPNLSDLERKAWLAGYEAREGWERHHNQQEAHDGNS